MNEFRIGIINNIEFIPYISGDLLVTLLFNDNIFISKDATSVIYSSDLIGAKALANIALF
jgi:hypothetical protein